MRVPTEGQIHTQCNYNTNSKYRTGQSLYVAHDRPTRYYTTSLHSRQLHCLKAKGRIDFQLALLVYKCQHGAAPSYLTDELSQPPDFEARRRLRSASSPSLIVGRTRLSTIGDRAFPITAARVWNGLLSMSRPHHHCLSSAAV